MKIFATFFFFLAFSYGAVAQDYTLQTEDFTKQTKALFAEAKKRFSGAKSSEKQTINEGNYVAAYATTLSFAGAASARIVVDGEGITTHQSLFSAGTDKAKAKQLLQRMLEVLTANAPDKFVQRDNYEGNYVGGYSTVLEYDSEVFAIQAKQPSAQIGLLENKQSGQFTIEVLFIEPVFK